VNHSDHANHVERGSPCGLIAVAAFLLASCATTEPRPSDRADMTLLGFLEDGTTTQEMVVLKLGQPSLVVSSDFCATGAPMSCPGKRDRILTYKVGFEKGHGYWVVTGWYGWKDATYSLVLVFDQDTILAQHSLIQVR
jgi:hypothetical protein